MYQIRLKLAVKIILLLSVAISNSFLIEKQPPLFDNQFYALPKAVQKPSIIFHFGRNPRPAVNLAMNNEDVSKNRRMLVLAYPIGALIGFFLSKTPSLFQIIEKLPISPYNDINKFNKTDRWERIQRELDDIEIKYNVDIVYAAEISNKAVQPDFLDTRYRIRFVYVNKNGRKPSKSAGDESFILKNVENNMFKFDGEELSVAVRKAQRLDLETLNSLFSAIVYRDSDVFNYGKEMRELLKTQVKVSDLLQNLLSSLEISYKSVNSGSGRVFAGSYISTIHNAAQLAWTMLNYADATENTTIRKSHKLIETNVGTIVNELHASGQLDDKVFKAIIDLIKQTYTMNSYDFIDSSDTVNDWMMQTIFKGSELLKKIKIDEDADSLLNGMRLNDDASINSEFNKFISKISRLDV